jgi:hypothetical protein
LGHVGKHWGSRERDSVVADPICSGPNRLAVCYDSRVGYVSEARINRVESMNSVQQQRIHRSRGAISARLILFLAIVSFPFCWFGYVILNQTLTGGIQRHGDYSEVDLKSLGNFPLDGSNGSLNDIPSRWRDLNGKRVLLEGFMYAPNAAGYQVNDFQFVYNISKCCFNGPPQVQERVFVTASKGAVPYYSDLVRVVGTLHVNVAKEAGIIKSVYTLDLEKVDPN